VVGVRFDQQVRVTPSVVEVPIVKDIEVPVPKVDMPPFEIPKEIPKEIPSVIPRIEPLITPDDVKDSPSTTTLLRQSPSLRYDIPFSPFTFDRRNPDLLGRRGRREFGKRQRRKYNVASAEGVLDRFARVDARNVLGVSKVDSKAVERFVAIDLKKSVRHVKKSASKGKSGKSGKKGKR
jgi:hypothetical protein